MIDGRKRLRRVPAVPDCCTICANCTAGVVCNAARAQDLEVSYSLPDASANCLSLNQLAKVSVLIGTFVKLKLFGQRKRTT